MTSTIFGPSQQRPFFPDLFVLRNLFKLYAVNVRQLQLLMTTAEQLANHAFHHMRDPLDGGPSDQAVETLGLRFLVMHTLFKAAHAVATEEPPWWGQLAAAFPPTPTYPLWRTMPFFARCRIELLNRLVAALEKLMEFENPGDEEVVNLMRVLFRGQETAQSFRHPRWIPWKKDAD